MFLQPKAGHDAQWAGRLPRQWVGLREELGFQATLKEPANEQDSWPGCWVQNQPGLDRGWAQESEETPREAVWSGLWPQVSLSWKLPLVRNLNLALTRRAWVVPELDGHNSMPIGRQARGHSMGCLSASLDPIGMWYTHRQTLGHSSVRLGGGWSPYVRLGPCLPALTTHLAVLRFL